MRNLRTVINYLVFYFSHDEYLIHDRPGGRVIPNVTSEVRELRLRDIT